MGAYRKRAIEIDRTRFEAAVREGLSNHELVKRFNLPETRVIPLARAIRAAIAEKSMPA